MLEERRETEGARTLPLPPVTDRVTWRAQIDALQHLAALDIVPAAL